MIFKLFATAFNCRPWTGSFSRVLGITINSDKFKFKVGAVPTIVDRFYLGFYFDSYHESV